MCQKLLVRSCLCDTTRSGLLHVRGVLVGQVCAQDEDARAALEAVQRSLAGREYSYDMHGQARAGCWLAMLCMSQPAFKFTSGGTGWTGGGVRRWRRRRLVGCPGRGVLEPAVLRLVVRMPSTCCAPRRDLLILCDALSPLVQVVALAPTPPEKLPVPPTPAVRIAPPPPAAASETATAGPGQSAAGHVRRSGKPQQAAGAAVAALWAAAAAPAAPFLEEMSRAQPSALMTLLPHAGVTLRQGAAAKQGARREGGNGQVRHPLAVALGTTGHRTAAPL
jgi:hypothetical protein